MEDATARATLTRLRVEVSSRLAALEADLRELFEASRSANTDDEHDPEGATIAFERAQLTALVAAARRQLTELDETWVRLEAGGYGSCLRCGRAIPDERLAARPTAATCVSCAA